jgi:hypothetical protein
MDFKGVVIFVSSIIVGNFNEILQGIGLGANIIYIGYQIYTHHKNNDKG